MENSQNNDQETIKTNADPAMISEEASVSDQNIEQKEDADKTETGKKNYDKEKELFMKGFQIGKKAGLVAVTITGLTSGVGILKTVFNRIIRN